ncbi:MAG: nitroreductase family protein [Bacillota bacterium]
MQKIDWESAINARRSTRVYQERAVEESKMDLLKGFIGDLRVPFEHGVKVRLFKTNPDKRLYTVFRAPPDGAAFLSETDVRSISAAGFVGETLVLYATSLGLSTCWYGHYSLAELESIMPHLGPHASSPMPRWGYGSNTLQGVRAICITPLGYAETKGLRFPDRLTGMLFSHRRKPVGAFLEGGMTEERLPAGLLYALDLARKAPSAVNSQFWRFGVSPDFKVVSISRPVGYRHMKWEHPDVDIGICACHFWLGLLMSNVGCDVSLTEEQGRAVWRFQP